MTATLISSQAFLDDEIVEKKISDCDFVVAITPVMVIDGEEYQAIIDGHHSLAAARLAGVEPDFVVYDATDDDRIGLDTEDYLEAAWMDTDWYIYDKGVGATLF
jgi:hypothetical protein